MSLSHLEFLRITATLQTLEIEQCLLEGSKFSAFEPALNQCSQLLKVKFYGIKSSPIFLVTLC